MESKNFVTSQFSEYKEKIFLLNWIWPDNTQFSSISEENTVKSNYENIFYLVH